MEQNTTPNSRRKKIGYLVLGFVISGFVASYAIQQSDKRQLAQSADVFHRSKPQNITIVSKTTDTTAEYSIGTPSMPPPPDMGAILAAQKEEDVGDAEDILTIIDPQITAAIPASKGPLLTSVSPVSVEENATSPPPVKPSVVAIAHGVPIPIASPKKKRKIPASLVKKTPSKARTGTPDVLVLGDSQISVSAGPTYQKFFSNLPSICKADKARHLAAANIDFSSTASVGVRSTSLHSWVARSGAAKGTICDVDKKWGVNAGVWGIGGSSKRKYVQIGKGKHYKFCKPKSSAFESMFANGYYHPKLLIMAFLGNSADRWANSKKSALKDVRSTLAQIPEDTACIFMTSAPVYSRRVNDVRMRAQRNIAEAFEKTGNRCTVVKGFTSQIRAEIEGNKTYFRTTKSGKIADKFHPNSSAIKKFIKHHTPALCKAFHKQFG